MSWSFKFIVFAGAFSIGLLASCNSEGPTQIVSSMAQNSSSGTRSSNSSNNISAASGTVIIGHDEAELAPIPSEWLDSAIAKLVIAYGHTSHGSQLVTGIAGLETWKGSPYLASNLQLRDTPFATAQDLGSPDFVSWVSATRTYLNENSDVNVVMWSWCGQLSWADEASVQGYLDSMTSLESAYPKVRFVYFTGHLDGTGWSGTVNQNNETIRAYVREYGKILYDFADIESYDPDGNGYLELNANDNCDYDGGNWCTAWQAAHPGEWYEVTTQHSQSLNGNLKAFAAWHLFARLAGWDGK